MALVARPGEFDLDLAQKPLQDKVLGDQISQALSVKGFCLISPDLDRNVLAGAQEEIKKLNADGRFEQPPAAILEGLLGFAGSARIAEMNLPRLPGEERPSGDDEGECPSLRELDDAMTNYGIAIRPHLARMNVEVTGRTVGTIHEAGMPDEDGPPLTEDVCANWIQQFSYHRVMCVWALGPEEGSMELQPFDDESNSSSVRMKPGSFMMLRPDALAHRFSSVGKTYCMTSFFLHNTSFSKHKPESEFHLTPCVQQLEEWAQGRMKSFKENGDDSGAISLPRQWERILNHSRFTGQYIAVRTAAVREPSTWDPDCFSTSFYPGVDYGIEIPSVRFNIEQFYDANPDAVFEPQNQYAQKTCCKHTCFIDGAELFDNSIFRLSKAEAGGMDPGCRMILESGYECLVRDGFKIRTLLNSRGGVYIANPPPAEWGSADKTGISYAGVCGGGGSIACGRFSFTHGMKGPCISCDTEGASSLCAVSFAATNLSRTGNWDPIPFAMISSYQLVLSAFFLKWMSAQRWLSPKGRTFSYDASANGWVRAESNVSLCLKALFSYQDDEPTIENSGDFLGAVAAVAMNQSGRSASMGTPDASTLQDVMQEAVKMCSISPFDVDAAETWGNGHILSDAIEGASTAKAFRPEGTEDIDSSTALMITTPMGGIGNQLECQGLSMIVKVCLGASYGALPPLTHLRILNPHLDIFMCERFASLPVEAVEYSLDSSYTGLSNRSPTGTNCHAIMWGQVLDSHATIFPEAPQEREKILFWPEGGGEMDSDKDARRGYSIKGTFNGWKPVDMEAEENGVWGITLTLGDSRWERFQICLDGDANRVLHPGGLRAEKGAPVLGPDEAFHKDSWIIDGRENYPFLGMAVNDDGAQEPSWLYLETDPIDRGMPGDQYRVRICVKGKYRTVNWEKIGSGPAPPVSSYSIIGSWNDWTPVPMVASKSEFGMFEVEMRSTTVGAFFQIIRNGDWGQVIYPSQDEADTTAVVMGPDEPMSNYWLIPCEQGDNYKIKFSLAAGTATADKDTLALPGESGKKVSWELINNVPLSAEERDALGRPSYYVYGADVPLTKMNWNGQYYQFIVELGRSATMSFILTLNGSLSQLIYPSEDGASPHSPHEIVGPTNIGSSSFWTIGAHESDDAIPGRRYEIKLFCAKDGSPTKISWVPVMGTVDSLEASKGQGYFAIGN